MSRPRTASERVRSYQRARLAERIEVDGVLVHPNAPHGTVSGYNYWGCRCLSCSTAWSDYQALRRREVSG